MTSRIPTLTIAAAFSLLPVPLHAQQVKAVPYLTAMPNYEIIEGEDKQFDQHRFCDGKRLVAVEGKYWRRIYQIKEGARQASPIQILRNYATAVKGLGGGFVFEGRSDSLGEGNCEGFQSCDPFLTAKAVKGDKELWVEVAPCNDGYDYALVMVEKEAMKQDVTASSMLDALNRDGHVALYINFDTGKATIKPESRPIIEQIVQLLKGNPGLKLAVEGHTDNVGNPKSNKTLSEDRAKSVVAELVKNGIDAKRLTPLGHGQDKPIADNATEAGRAKNRRVELVKM